MAGRTPARILALLALIAAGVAIYLVVSSGLKDSSSSSHPSSGATSGRGQGAVQGGTKKQRKQKRARQARFYVVRSGDSLSGIAQRTGVSLEQIVELNPNIDPQEIHVGERLKIRP